MTPDEAEKLAYTLSSLISLAFLWWIGVDLLSDWIERRFLQPMRDRTKDRP
jgi:hypothetical protein